MRAFSIIVAVDAHLGIGKGGQLPWHLPTDLKHFKDITNRTQHPGKMNAVIMGRKTWLALPERFRPLPKRYNVVLSRSQDSTRFVSASYLARNFNETMEFLAQSPQDQKIENIFIIGGGQVFQQTVILPACNKIYLTKILFDFQCDTFFPPIPPDFQEVSKSSLQTEQSLSFYFSEWHRTPIS